jgi:hypothetical protein
MHGKRLVLPTAKGGVAQTQSLAQQPIFARSATGWRVNPKVPLMSSFTQNDLDFMSSSGLQALPEIASSRVYVKWSKLQKDEG